MKKSEVFPGSFFFCYYYFGLHRPDMVSCFVDLARAITIAPVWVYPTFYRCLILWYKFGLQNIMINGHQNTRKDRTVSYLQRHQFLVSTKFVLLFFYVGVFVFFVSLALIIYFLDPTEDIYGCYRHGGYLMMEIEGGIALGMIIFSIWLLWNTEDAYLIKVELGALLFLGTPFFLVWAVSAVLQWTGLLLSMFWHSVIEVVFILCSLYIPLIGSFLYTRVFHRYKVLKSEPSTDPATQIDAIISHPLLRSDFELFCQKTWSVENLLFYLSVRRYKTLPPEQLLDEARKMHADYIAEGSILQINLVMGDREAINERVMEEKADASLFKEAEQHVIHLLRFSIIPLWTSSAGYKDLMKKQKVENFHELSEMDADFPSSGNL